MLDIQSCDMVRDQRNGNPKPDVTAYPGFDKKLLMQHPHEDTVAFSGSTEGLLGKRHLHVGQKMT